MHITGGYLKSRKIDSPKGVNVRPTLSQVRESIFSTLYSLIDFENKVFLDAFAGSGIMGFEALSRGFSEITFLEKDKKTYFFLKENAQKLNVCADFFLGDSLKILKKIEKKFDIIYVDPPYQGGLYDDILGVVKDRNLLREDGFIVLEHPKSLNINFQGYNIVKVKNYADKSITILSI